MNNQDIRQSLKTANIHQWEVADCLGVSEFTLTRWLRKELSPERKADIFAIIDSLSKREAKTEQLYLKP